MGFWATNLISENQKYSNKLLSFLSDFLLLISIKFSLISVDATNPTDEPRKTSTVGFVVSTDISLIKFYDFKGFKILLAMQHFVEKRKPNYGL